MRQALFQVLLKGWLALAFVSLAFAAQADGAVFRVPTRDGVTTPVFWEATPNAQATVLLFPGGGGGFGRVEGGKASSNNFLVRSVAHFVARGFHVAIFGRPSDSEDLDFADRVSAAHLTDVKQVLAFVHSQAEVPIWLIGTSRGSISAAAAAIAWQDRIAGLVLTSSVVSYKKTGAIPTQDLAALKLPVLVLHHAKDACVLCQPHEVPAILRGLKNAPIKKEIMLTGGANPTGDSCGALHWHGFIGMEREAVDWISNWIQSPSN